MLGNLTISRKLYLGFGLLNLLLILLAGFIASNLDALDHSTEARAQSLRQMAALEALEGSFAEEGAGLWKYGFSGSADSLALYNESRLSLAEDLALARKESAPTPEIAAELERAVGMITAWRHDYAEPFLQRREEVAAGKLTLEAFSRWALEREASSHIRPIVELFNDSAKKARERNLGFKAVNLELRERTKLGLIVAAVLATLLGVAVSVGIARSTVRRLALAVQATDRMAAGDLTQPVAVAGRDEIASLLGALAAMQQRLAGIIASIQNNADQVDTLSHAIVEQSGQISEGVREQSQAASAIAAAVEQLTVSIRHVSDSASEAHALARQSGDSTEHGYRVIHSTVDDIRGVEEVVQSVNTEMRSLETSAQQISSVVEVIRDISDQTNLLALNASIEAARAGDSGRGFAVVADEVRKLAERTGNSTQEIAGMIGQIQQRSSVVSEQLQLSVERVGSGVERSGQAGTVMDDINQSSRRVVNLVTDISAALTQQSQASNAVASRIETIAQMAEESSHAVDEAVRHAGHLEELAAGLRREVAFFRL
ncbi:methyl-accepting chemotaxis protein [Neisseriaceae bacterium JH1-16]|nr:methyl-accepting chemotaxis protein [Neisseriaceae bacterium JH1-16]